jgi:tetratricopeptide (TPR) repeat protein
MRLVMRSGLLPFSMAGRSIAFRKPSRIYGSPMILRVLAALEAGMGEPERAIEHGHECLRLNPRDHRSYSTHVLLSFACFAAKRYVEGIGWSSRALNALPGSPSAHLNLAVCLVGAGDAERARGVFAAGQRLAPEFFKMRLEGKSSLYRQPDDRVRLQTFLRIAAGLEDPTAAAAFR